MDRNLKTLFFLSLRQELRVNFLDWFGFSFAAESDKLSEHKATSQHEININYTNIHDH